MFFLFWYLLMNILLQGVIADHRTDTHIPSTNGLNSMGCNTLTTPRWVPVERNLALLGSVCSHNPLCLDLTRYAYFYFYFHYFVRLTYLHGVASTPASVQRLLHPLA